MFREEKAAGILMKAEPDERTRFKYTIWFDYTRDLINKITDGDFVVIQNYSSDKTAIKYSVLEIINVLPFHYAIGSDLKGYPGFVKEAAKSASLDLVEQDTEPTEDTTKIICEAIPTNFEFKDVSKIEDLKLEQESTMAMVGTEVKLIGPELTRKIVNHGINEEKENVIVAGKLLRDEELDILVRIEELIKTHFAVFGFTGVGKSNFVSTIVSTLLNKSNEKGKEKIKIVLFDMMSEYLGIIIDQVLNPNSKVVIVCIGERTLPQSVLDFINELDTKKKAELLQKATADLLNNLYLPKKLKPRKADFEPFVKEILTKNKIKIYEFSTEMTVEEFLRPIIDDVFDQYVKGSLKVDLEKVIKKYIEPFYASKLTAELAAKIATSLETEKTGKETFDKRVGVFIYRFNQVAEAKKKALNPQAKITLWDIIRDLGDANNSSLFLINSHDPHEMRKFSKQLGYWTYENRRKTGNITPLVSFIFDEADEFIPQQATGTYQDSKEIIETLARRGRKFGLGIGIATQRVVYLDTNIMGQPHTYFISKLPRKSDRERVAEAFAVPEDMFTQTFKFQKGNWLLVSHDATGLDAVPIPIKTHNAEDRIWRWLDVAHL